MTIFCSNGHANSTDSRFCRLCGEALSVPVAAGELLGWRYRIVAELGHGGFGRTYLAADTNRFDEHCVLKELAPQVDSDSALQKAQELFAREAGILYKLQHAQIPSFREMFRATWQGHDGLFLVQDYVEGDNYYDLLKQRQRQGKTFAEAEVVQLLQQLLPVLDYIHCAGVIHRDISPDNLIRRSQDELPVLIDFGGVKQMAARVLSSGEIAPLPPGTESNVTRLGKVGYAPAEQLEQGEVYPHSDLYALAVTILVLVTGKEPQELFGGAKAGDRRAWQHQIQLPAALIAVLNRMLDPYPTKRYQSAQAVLQALATVYTPASPGPGAAKVGPVAPPLSPKVAAPLASPPSAAATIAIARKAVTNPGTQALAPASPAVPRRSRPPGRSRAIAMLLLLLSMAAGGWWLGVVWLGPALKDKLPEIIKSSGAGGDTPPASTKDTFSPAEQARKAQIADRQKALQLDNGFLVRLVNEGFYTQHPNLKGRKLKTTAADAQLRQAWDELALETLDRLEGLSPAVRQRLGRYSMADVRDRQNAIRQLNLSSNALNDLTDASFFRVFPEQPQGDNLLDRAIGQVWQGMADDRLKALQTGQTWQRVEFSAGNFSQRLSGNLKPGEGHAYVANLGRNQTLKLQLQVPDQTTSLSLYPPTSKNPALLADSRTTTWTGTLPESGFYEIVLVADGANPVDYTLDLAVAETVSLSDRGGLGQYP